MKAITSKFLSLVLLACFCTNFVSCKKDKDEPTPPVTKSLVGVWRMYNYRNGQKMPTETYFRINDDYTAELLGNAGTESKPAYVYCTGSYTSQNGWVYITYSTRTYYIIENNLLRCVSEYKDDESYLRYSSIYIISRTDDEIEANLNDMKVYLRKSSIPAYWLSEWSEKAVTPSEQTMTFQWDLRSYYVLEGDSYSYWWVNDPESSGITFAQNGRLGNCTFWANEVWAIENKAGRVGRNDRVFLPSENCTWTISGKTLTMTCSSYTWIRCDISGTEISRQTVTPTNPIESTYHVYTLSASWMTLYSSVTSCYYSFHRHDDAI